MGNYSRSTTFQTQTLRRWWLLLPVSWNVSPEPPCEKSNSYWRNHEERPGEHTETGSTKPTFQVPLPKYPECKVRLAWPLKIARLPYWNRRKLRQCPWTRVMTIPDSRLGDVIKWWLF